MREEQIFHQALERAADQRAAFLAAACGDDVPLRQRVEVLLQAQANPGSFLQSHAPGISISPTIDQASLERPGSQIGPYKLLQQLGEGGMGVVYMAEQAEPVQRKVALKVIKPGMDSRQVIARFEAERQALALMDHVNIARVLDAGATEAGRPYFVMELVHGVPITKYCDDNRLTPRQRLELFVPVCQAIQHAHQKGIIHRDIKPSNVMVTLYDGKPVPKVIDFGVAKATEQKLTERTLFTQYGTMVGTLEYMSPEQAEMSALGVDTRSDIYSLGVLLYELLTGSTPLSRKRMKDAAYAEILRLIKEEEPPKPSTRLSDSGEAIASISAQRQMEPAKLTNLVRGELDWIVMKTLEKDRGRRYETANAFAADVQRYLNDEPVLACPPTAMYRFRKFSRRNKAALAMVAVVLSALCVATIGLAISNVLVRAERNEKIQALDEKGKALGEKQVALSEREGALTQAQANYVEAKRQEELAQTNAENAKQQQRFAQEQEVLARRRFYAAQMNLAMRAWEGGQPARMLQLLESQRPRFDQEDLRGFDWYYLWRLCQGAYRFSLPTLNYDNATAIAVSPDGKTLASGYGRTVRLWDLSTGHQSGELAGHSNVVGWLAFAPDGKTLASSDETESVKLWDLTNGKQVATVHPGQVVKGVQFIGNSQTLVLVGKHIKLWDVGTDRQVAALFESNKVHFSCVAVALDGSAVAASDADRVRIWVREEQKWRATSPLTDAGYHPPLAISADGKLLATGGRSLRLFDLPSRQQRTVLQGHTGPVYAIAFSRDGNRLASAGQDRTVRMWDTGTGEQQVCIAHPGPVYGLALTPDASVVAAMGADAIRVGGVTSPTLAVVLPQAAHSRTVAFSPNGKMLASAGLEGTILWDPIEGRKLVTLGHDSPRRKLFGLAFSPDGKSLATTGVDEGTIDIWDVTGRRLGVLKGTGKGLAYSPDGKSLAATSDNGSVSLWEVASQQLRHVMPVSQTSICVAFSPDGQTIAAGGQFGVVKLFDAASGQERSTIQRFELAVDYALTLAFSPDGRKLATGNRQGVVRLWDLATDQLDMSLIGHTDAVQSLAFADGGRTLATASDDRTIRFWDVSTGQERLSLKGSGREIMGISFDSNGSLLATSGKDGMVRLWHAAVDANARARKREVDPDDAQSPVAHNERGDRLWQRGRIAEAETAFRQALERLENLIAAFPDDHAYQQELVRSLLSISLLLRVERDHHPDAEPARVRACEVYGKLTVQDQEAMFFAYQERHRKLNGSANTQQADRIYSQLIELMPTDDVVWLTRASNHLENCSVAKLRDPQRAAELASRAAAGYTKAIELRPNDWELWSGRAFVYFRKQQWDQAISDFSKAIDLAPHMHTNWWHRGHVYLHLAQWDKAASDFGNVVERWPDGSEGWYLRGVAFAQLDQPDKAIADLRQAIANGFKNVEQIKNDPRLAPLRTREGFDKLLTELEPNENLKNM